MTVRKGDRVTLRNKKEYVIVRLTWHHVDLQKAKDFDKGESPVATGYLSLPYDDFWQEVRN